MGGIFAAVPAVLAAFSAAEEAVSTTIATAGSADSAAMTSAAATALGPIGAPYLMAYGPAQANNLAGTLLVGAVHAGIAAATNASQSAIVAADNA